MPKEKNNNPEYLGKTYGRLTVIGFRHKDGFGGQWFWDCRCTCGKIVYGALPKAVKSGNTASCGCLKVEQNMANLADHRRTHGLSETRLYSVWCQMKSRCERETDHAYPNYGGRGIKLCSEWHDFQVFYEWAVLHGYREGLTIERVDVNGNYCPENCTWIPRSEQAKNKRDIRYVTVDGEKLPLKAACKKLGLPYKAVHLRITRRGWDPERALTTPLIKGANGFTYRK